MPGARQYIVCTLCYKDVRDKMRPSPISAITTLLDMESPCRYSALQHWRRVCTSHSHARSPASGRSLARLMLFPANTLDSESRCRNLSGPRTALHRPPPPELSAPPSAGILKPPLQGPPPRRLSGRCAADRLSTTRGRSGTCGL